MKAFRQRWVNNALPPNAATTLPAMLSAALAHSPLHTPSAPAGAKVQTFTNRV